MTLKEKAKELVNKFYPYVETKDFYGDIVEARFSKECALIAVDEIQATETLSDRQCGYLQVEKKHKEYWEIVKYEIKNIN